MFALNRIYQFSPGHNKTEALVYWDGENKRLNSGWIATQSIAPGQRIGYRPGYGLNSGLESGRV